jgi:hypothetical protein
MFSINSVASAASTTNGTGAKQENAEKHRRHVTPNDDPSVVPALDLSSLVEVP